MTSRTFLPGCRIIIAALAALAVIPAVAAPPSPAIDDGHVILPNGREAMRAIRSYSHPPYPLQARRERRQLATVIRLYVAPDGRVTRTRPLVTTGDKGLLDYVQEYIQMNYRFPRLLVRGRPAQVCFDIPVVFVKEGEAGGLRAAAAKLGPGGARLVKILGEEMQRDAERDRLRRSIRVPDYRR